MVLLLGVTFFSILMFFYFFSPKFSGAKLVRKTTSKGTLFADEAHFHVFSYLTFETLFFSTLSLNIVKFML